MTWPLQYRIDRIPPASSSAISILPTNIVFPNSASSGSTLRVDSKRQRTSLSGSVVVSRSRAAFCANRASRASRRSRAASTSCASASSFGSIFTGTRRGRTSSPIFTNTRCELSVTARAPVATSSAQTRTPTSSDDVPTYSTCALRIAIWPTLTGWRKSISSIAPRTTWPRATRTAASVPAWVIHSIIRPPWIWPGAPACSGNTHWTISTTVSAIDGIRALYHLGRLLGRREREQEQVRVARGHRRLEEGQVVVAFLENRARRVERLGPQRELDVLGAEGDLDGLGNLGQVHRRCL